MSTQMETRSQNRAAYDFISAQSKKAGLENVLAYPGYLRSERLLGVGQSIDFNILDNQTSDGQVIGGTERRLQQNDAFYVSRMSVMLYVAEATVAGAQAAQLARAQARLQQFPNTQVFAGNIGAAVGFWNGALTIKQNDKIYCRDHDLWTLQYADTAQQGQTVFTASTVDSNAFKYEDAFQQVLDPMFRLNGQSNIEANIQLPASLDFLQQTTTSVYAVLYLKGWRAQNAGVARSAK